MNFLFPPSTWLQEEKGEQFSCGFPRQREEWMYMCSIYLELNTIQGTKIIKHNEVKEIRKSQKYFITICSYNLLCVFA